jgi:hypothetical protein
MIRAVAASTSTLERVAPPAWKNRQRTAPVISTTSPGRQVTIPRRNRGLHALHGTESTR